MLAETERCEQSDEMFRLLVRGDEQACRDYLLSQVEEAGASMLDLCLAMTTAFHRIGDAWECAELGVYREHIASQLALRLLSELRLSLGAPNPRAPVAIGCAPAGDPYDLPTCMIELVLREQGWRAFSLGSNLPLGELTPAMDDMHPQLCWISVSSTQPADQFQDQLALLGQEAIERGVRLICGGREIDPETCATPGIELMLELTDLSQLPLGNPPVE